MSADSRPRLRGLLIITALLALFVVAPAANAATTNEFKNPKDNYLALGDSLAFGYQGAKVNACAGSGCASPNTQFTTGYVNDFAAAIGSSRIVNYGCPGETSSTLLNDTNATTGCTTYPFPLHDNHPGQTQIQAAVAYLNRNANQTNPITFNIGANDLLRVITQCTVNPTPFPDTNTCIGARAVSTINTVAANATNALRQLRAAAPRANIIVLGLYNTGALTIPGSDALINGGLTPFGPYPGFNGIMAGVAADPTINAKFANPYPTINQNPAYPAGPPFGTAAANSLCSQIAVCTTNPPDVHPFDNGYQGIADVIHAASGF